MLAPLHSKICAAFMAGPEELQCLSQEIAAKVADERSKAENSPGLSAPDPDCLEEATRQARLLSSADPKQDERAIGDWMLLLGGRYESASRDGIMLGWDKSKLRRPLNAIPGVRVRRVGTFKRRQALRDESLEFFAPGHPVVDELIRDLLSGPDGRACGLRRDLGQLQAKNVFLILTGWMGPAPDQPDPPHELVRNDKRRWPRLCQRVVLLGGKGSEVADTELMSRIIAPRADSDADLAPNDIEISEAELNAAFKLATNGLGTNGAEPFHSDSVALIVGSG